VGLGPQAALRRALPRPVRTSRFPPQQPPASTRFRSASSSGTPTVAPLATNNPHAGPAPFLAQPTGPRVRLPPRAHPAYLQGPATTTPPVTRPGALRSIAASKATRQSGGPVVQHKVPRGPRLHNGEDLCRAATTTPTALSPVTRRRRPACRSTSSAPTIIEGTESKRREFPALAIQRRQCDQPELQFRAPSSGPTSPPITFSSMPLSSWSRSLGAVDHNPIPGGQHPDHRPFTAIGRRTATP